jgi:putative membrane protein insertion efficiency factor
MLKNISIEFIQFYQRYLSKHIGGHCVFEPSCSEYAKLAIQKYGFIYGWLNTLKRIARCSPSNGGYDFP